jgi:hypothetical protein
MAALMDLNELSNSCFVTLFVVSLDGIGEVGLVKWD